MTDDINYQCRICPKCFDDHQPGGQCKPVSSNLFIPHPADQSYIAREYRKLRAQLDEARADLKEMDDQLKGRAMDIIAAQWPLIKERDAALVANQVMREALEEFRLSDVILDSYNDCADHTTAYSWPISKYRKVAQALAAVSK